MMKFWLVLLMGMLVAPAAAIDYPLSISADGRQLLESDGDALFLNAATPWHIVARLDQAEVIEYLDTRRDQGFNALLMSLVVPGSYSGSVLNAYGQPPFHTPGVFSTPNEAYFAHADWIMQQAHQRGMLILLCHTYVGYNCGAEGWCADMKSQGVTAMRNWGRWLGQRYRNVPNIVWVNGGDVDASLFGAGAHVDAVAEGILERDDIHLQTAHCTRFASGADCYDRPWLDFDTTYADCSTTSSELHASYNDQPTRPTLYIEGTYEAAPGATHECQRRQAWIPTLGGAVGHSYGSEDVWDFPSGWPNALDTESAESMQVLDRLVRLRRWAQFVPDYAHDVVVSGYGSLSSAWYVPSARASDGSTVVAYFPSQQTIGVDLAQISGATAEAWWMDPATGEAELDGNYPTQGVHNFTPPSGGDWVLVIDDRSLPLVDPWSAPTDAPDRTPTQLTVADPHPNPFNPRTSIRFTASAGAPVEIHAFDARGRMVDTLFVGSATGAPQSVQWNARELPSGVYHLRVRAGEREELRQVVLVR